MTIHLSSNFQFGTRTVLTGEQLPYHKLHPIWYGNNLEFDGSSKMERRLEVQAGHVLADNSTEFSNQDTVLRREDPPNWYGGR